LSAVKVTKVFWLRNFAGLNYSGCSLAKRNLWLDLGKLSAYDKGINTSGGICQLKTAAMRDHELETGGAGYF